jgi:hypothetical protein
MAAYGNMDYVSIAFATDADKAAALIPKELELLSIPALQGQAAANLVFAKYRACDLGPYMEVIVSIPVVHNGQVYGYIPAIYVDNDAALLAGRELGGYPKKMAQITMRNYGDLFLSHMARGSIQKKTADPNFSDLASSSVTKGGKLFSVPLPADTTPQLPPPYNLLLPMPPATGQPQDYVVPTAALRRIPGIGGRDPTATPELSCSSSWAPLGTSPRPRSMPPTPPAWNSTHRKRTRSASSCRATRCWARTSSGVICTRSPTSGCCSRI